MFLRQVRQMHVKAIKMRWHSGGMNYSYLLSTHDKKQSWLIDPAEPIEVLSRLTDQELESITALVNTHHHQDHSGGNIVMLEALERIEALEHIIAGSETSPGASLIPKHKQCLNLGNLQIVCIRTPCHTKDSICYWVTDKSTGQQCLFSGDTLFNGGCGRFFEGTANDMNNSLNKILLACIPNHQTESVKIYPGHEYTRDNAKFARRFIYKSEGQNSNFDKMELSCLEPSCITTGLFSLKDELKHNPFMRLDDPYVRAAVNDSKNNLSHSEVMHSLRELKNSM